MSSSSSSASSSSSSSNPIDLTPRRQSRRNLASQAFGKRDVVIKSEPLTPSRRASEGTAKRKLNSDINATASSSSSSASTSKTSRTNSKRQKITQINETENLEPTQSAVNIKSEEDTDNSRQSKKRVSIPTASNSSSKKAAKTIRKSSSSSAPELTIQHSETLLHDIHFDGSEIDANPTLPWKHDGNRLRRAGSPLAHDGVDSIPALSVRRSPRSAQVTPRRSATVVPNNPEISSVSTSLASMLITEEITTSASVEPSPVDITLPDESIVNSERSATSTVDEQIQTPGESLSLYESYVGDDWLTEWSNYFDSLDSTHRCIYFGIVAIFGLCTGIFAANNHVVESDQKPCLVFQILDTLLKQTIEMRNVVDAVSAGSG